MKWNLGWVVLGLACAVGCGGGLEPTAEEAMHEQGSKADPDADISSSFSSSLSAYTVASSYKLLTAASSELNIFQHAALGGTDKALLKWDGGNYGGSKLRGPKRQLDGYTQVTDNYGGQCVGFVRAEDVVDIAPINWHKGVQVTATNNLPAGTVIATFSGNSYYGHTAFFLGYASNGILVMDQNWYKDPKGRGGLVAKHVITNTGHGSESAPYFYAVEVAK